MNRKLHDLARAQVFKAQGRAKKSHNTVGRGAPGIIVQFCGTGLSTEPQRRDELRLVSAGAGRLGLVGRALCGLSEGPFVPPICA